MQIKYLKDAPLGQTGDIADVPDDQARVLIILGLAKVYDGNDDDDDAGDLFGQLDDNQDAEPLTADQEPSETENTEPVADDQEPSETDIVHETAEHTDDNSEQAQPTAENTPAEPNDTATTETAKPKKTKTKTDKN